MNKNINVKIDSGTLDKFKKKMEEESKSSPNPLKASALIRDWIHRYLNNEI